MHSKGEGTYHHINRDPDDPNKDLNQNGRESYEWLNYLHTEIGVCDEKIMRLEWELKEAKKRRNRAIAEVPNAIEEHTSCVTRLISLLKSHKSETID